MGYISRSGRKPSEFASKSSHSTIVNDTAVGDFLKKCTLPASAKDVTIKNEMLTEISEVHPNPVSKIIAIDGGYSEVSIKNEFPSSKIAFLQFGAVFFTTGDLEHISKTPFIEPKDMERLNNIQRFKLTLPTKNIIYDNATSFTDSFRKTIYDFFIDENNELFASTLKWFLFEEYDSCIDKWTLSNCPSCAEKNIELLRKDLENDYSTVCSKCKEIIYITDTFRLHEAIDNELGASGVLGYLITLLEHMTLIHLIKVIMEVKPDLLREILFIKDGPLAFFGQTANLHKPMRTLINFIYSKYDLFLAGLEKSGAFVEHAAEVAIKIPANNVLMLNNNHIYQYIMPSKSDISTPYGSTSYYSNKLIYKTDVGGMYVVSLPTRKTLLEPKRDDFKNLDIILSNISKLKCDMYENSLFPIALVNKLVSLSNHPSSMILEKFAKKTIK